MFPLNIGTLNFPQQKEINFLFENDFKAKPWATKMLYS